MAVDSATVVKLAADGSGDKHCDSSGSVHSTGCLQPFGPEFIKDVMSVRKVSLSRVLVRISCILSFYLLVSVYVSSPGGHVISLIPFTPKHKQTLST